ncbi:hypothetical protein M2325_000683 [Methanococcus voltae PS]|uniref:Uncharacterized protein n=1 Tax=Methanococcus voltae PS TaxID=523842 RepID=A0ABT2EVL3_METVO|nr:hypothetical protein [Methanococcus voltae]MCS3921998.1 hypothetical protein [Methanococcus voltae PS]
MKTNIDYIKVQNALKLLGLDKTDNPQLSNFKWVKLNNYMALRFDMNTVEGREFKNFLTSMYVLKNEYEDELEEMYQSSKNYEENTRTKYQICNAPLDQVNAVLNLVRATNNKHNSIIFIQSKDTPLMIQNNSFLIIVSNMTLEYCIKWFKDVQLLK